MIGRAMQESPNRLSFAETGPPVPDQSGRQSDAENVKVYDRLYRLYRMLYDSFGGVRKSSRIMKDLIEIKYAQRA